MGLIPFMIFSAASQIIIETAKKGSTMHDMENRIKEQQLFRQVYENLVGLGPMPLHC